MITPENALEIQHKDWLCHPTTIQMIKNIKVFKDTNINTLCKLPMTEDAETFKIISYGLKTIDTLLTSITNTKEFVALTNKKH